MQHHKRIAFTIGLAGMLAISAAVPAFAADNVTITGTAISQARNPGDLAFSAVLNGADQSVAATTNLTTLVKDNSGTGAGWKLFMTASPFTGTGGTFPANALSVTGGSAESDGSGAVTLPGNSAVYPTTVNATAALYYNAAVETGMGQFIVTPQLTLTVPSNTKIGSYVSTVVLTIAAGPA